MRILIVDDDAALAHMVRDQIQRLEPTFHAVAADSAEAARKAVQEADAPFDVFLIDQHLEGSDVDGVTLMRELLEASPESDAVILTGYDDLEAGLNAFAAGAYRYLTKPFDTRELIALLAWLEKYRHAKREGDWHRILAAFAREVQRELTVEGVGKMVVEYGPKLGFERGHLWLLSDDRQEWKGLHQYGYVGLDNFTSLRVPVADLPYPYRALTHGETLFFRGPEYGYGYLEEQFKSKGFRSPVGEWAEILLQAGERCIGALALDNDQKPRNLLPEQKGLLRLFGEQAAAALARAQLQEERDHQAREWKTLSDIGRQVTTQATQGNLDQLLDEVRKQVGEELKLDVSNFMVVLSDLETETFDFRRQYEKNQLADRHWRAASPTTGLSGDVIYNNEPRLIQDTKTYCIKHGITQYGPPAACWLGVPLRVEDDAIGAIVVQSYDDPHAYNEYHQRVLVAVAHQVAGAIRAAYQAERAREQTRQLEALQRVGVELPRLARERTKIVSGTQS